MGWRLAELFVEIGARMPGLDSALGGVRNQLLGLLPLGGRVGSGLASGIITPLLGITSVAGAAGIAIGVGLAAGAAAGLVKCATLASDLNETISKTEQVFGSATIKVTGAADEMAAKFGIVKTEFLDAASMFGLIAEGAGIASGKSADMSVTLAKLAADASSFYNVPVDVALEKMRAGLVGEAEPLRAFGVMLTEDAVKAKALAMGLAKPGQEISNQAKVMARYTLIQEGLAKASGDLERTGGGFANQWRQFTGQLENMATSIGSLVLPALTGLLQVANTVLGGISAGIEGFVGSWKEMLTWIGMGGEEAAEKATRLAEITTRNDKMANDAAKAGEKPNKEKEQKSQTFGFADFARSIQENSLNEKDKNGKEQIRLQREQIAIQKEQLAALQNRKQQPVIAVAKK
jgi:hypothetical protein